MPTHIQIPIPFLGTITLLGIVLLLRILLDLEMGIWVVRLFHWIPTRWIFRHRYVKLKGYWEQIWGGDVGRYKDKTHRHGHHYTYQFFRWVYAGTRSQGTIFSAFGRIQGDYLIGRWYDNTDEAGYFGAFQLRIVNGAELSGIWTGHSKQNPALIRSGTWKWNKQKSPGATI